MAGRILIRASAFRRLISTSILTSSFQRIHHVVSAKAASTFSNHLKISPNQPDLLHKIGFTQSQISNFLSKNHLFLTNSNLLDIEASVAVLLSFKILPRDLVSMAIDCPAVLDLEFLRKWEASLSLIELRNVSVLMIRSMLVLSKRFQLDSCIFITTVDLLKRLGLSDATVTRVLEDYPEIVFSNEEEILRTIEFLMGIGIRRGEIDRIICLIPKVLGFRVDGRLKSLIGEFNELGFDQNVIVREIVREPRILATELGEISRCLELLSNLKCRNSIKEKIFRDGALRAAFEVKQRVDCLCKHGLIRTGAFKLLWKEPRLITYELENIEKKIDFLTHKMKFGVDCLMDVPEYLGINFEKQIVPRYHVIEYLESKGWLGSQVGLREIIKPSRLRFYNLFVKPYPECGKMFGKFVGDNKMKSPRRHPIGLWKVFKPQKHPESKEDTKNMKSFMESFI
ncbi:transcription termination factor MTERF15, mitochondrial [Cucurbita moschata]|uniref:Transcription termination factor MTERF15, mitochondrial n=1 Tax=Cucurbita moschata TaxID=3662 RepID=A0A6J1EK12_CUCMO|nr:transcription termination factor MTERF15, mitochondrial [Cucurbita moschata]XP_022927087.1 transcription termination factor MTERF15, mitochondrial [Cucurbita moschata]XP_022927088.1 transcription termination factor MTERF15, mitochondrial [Cucurbita moschata]